jgi:hypothetical protein
MTLDRRVKVCVNQDGGTADSVFLQYADARPLKQPFLYRGDVATRILRSATCRIRDCTHGLDKNLGQRKREIGIRTAMGATAADILALTMKQGTVPVAIGLSMGLPAALARRPV